MPIILGYTEGSIPPPGPGGGGGGVPHPGEMPLPPPPNGWGEGDPLIAVQGSGMAQPRGLEAVIEYNGLVLHDRKVVDKYRILEIDGLADADIRDVREPNPSAHGETAFTARYGGRTISMTGRVEAWSLYKMRDMVQALHQAFADLIEKPLIFRTPEGVNDIQIWCRKSAPLQMREVQQNQFYFRDFLLTLRASNPRFVSRVVKSSTTDVGFSESFTVATTLSNYNIFDPGT